MRTIISIILLSVIWLLLTAEFTGENIILGLVISTLIISLKIRGKTKQAFNTRKSVKAYIEKFVAIISLSLYVLKEVLISTFQVAYDSLVIGKDIEPAIISIEIVTSSEAELVFLSNIITLTPGNLALDFEEDKSLIYVHLLNGNREESFRKSALIMDKKIEKILS
jgi:multicomponent Na+:H+ antiporter subunit E